MTIIPGVSARRFNVHLCDLPRTSDSNLPRLPPNARFYSRWKRNIQKLILVSVKHPLTRFFLRSQAAISFEKRKHGRSRFWWVIHPYSDFRFFWDALMMLTFFYVFVVIPYVISFCRIAKSSGPEYWNLVNPAYFICIFDIAFNFVTGYSSADGHEIFLDPLLIARQYAKGYFTIDLISSIPYTWFCRGRILPPGPNSNSILLFFEFLPVFKFLRIFTFRRHIRQIHTTFGVSHAQEMSIWLVILTLLIFHWSSCITHAFPHVVMHVRGETIQNSGAYQIETELYKKSDVRIYLMSLHIGVSNLVGSSFIELNSLGELDKVIRCILLLLGKGYTIYLIVIILQLVESSAESDLKYQEVMHQVKQYIRKKKLPKHLRDKLIAYYEYRFQGSFFKEHAISTTLSSHLNQEIAIHSCRALLGTSTIFNSLPRTTFGSLMAVLKPIIYLEGDVIYKCDTDGDCMFFIISGTVALITFYGKEICHVQDGGHFGEESLIYSDRRRSESVIALEVCELLRFDRRDFKRLFPLKSDFYNNLESIAKERSEKINELNKLHEESEERKRRSGVAANVPTEPEIKRRSAPNNNTINNNGSSNTNDDKIRKS